MPEQPNILLIMSDQHNPHIAGCARDKVVRTPVLDRLAARGVRFTNAYCPSPLCAPSRMAFLAARHCSDIKVWTNGCALAPEIPTFVHGLGAAGYEAVLCGRMHFCGADQRHGFHSRIIGDVDGNLGHIPRATVGQTKPCVEVAGPGRTAYSAYDDAVTATCCDFLRRRCRCLASDRAAGERRGIPPGGMPWGGKASPSERPFFITVGYVLPHCPYICPKRLFDEYYSRVDVPPLPPGYLEGLHPAVRFWRRQRGVDELSDEQVRVARAAYYGLITYMDERIGEIMQALEDSGLSEDTIVVYTSDHGDMAGEHRMWWKSNFYEGSVGVPLIVARPGCLAQGKRVEAVTSLVDVGPTLLDLVGAPPLPGVAGRSFAGFLRESGGPPDWPNTAFAEYCGLEGDRPAFMVRRGHWKLNYYHGYDTPQLFNITEDPGELRDRANDSACASVREELMDIVRRNWSGDFVETTLAQQRAQHELLGKWWQATAPELRARPSAPDRWKAPPDCNVFPET